MTLSNRIFSFLLIIAFGCDNNAGNITEAKTKDDEKAVKPKFTELDGTSISLDKYKNKTIFINYWATWCMPCIQEMPTIADAQSILKKEEIVFLLASNESAKEINEFSKTQDFKFKYIRVENFDALNIEALPATHILDKNGNLVFSEVGYRKWNDKSNIDTLMKIIRNDD